MKRKRLTITLDPQLLKKIDTVVNGKGIRNRSHAIEYLVKKGLPPMVKKAVILAGGPGIHFRPLTYEIPSVLIPFKGKPLLAHLIEQIKKTGIQEIVLCVGYLAEKVEDEFGNGEKWGVKLVYSHDGPKSLGTAGALLKARSYLKEGAFLVVHGDILTEIDLIDMVNFHEGGQYLATMALTTISDPQRYGTVKVKGKEVVSFNEKPEQKEISSNLIHAGIYILEQKAFDYFPQKTPAAIEKDVFPALVDEGKVAAYLFEGQWFDISYPEVYEEALKAFGNGK
jgi:NDP-sugar pyrophosphorylase family protein